MSFFTNLFQKEKPKEKGPPPPSAQDTQRQKMIDIQKALKGLQVQIEQMKRSQQKIDDKIDEAKQKAKILISQGKQSAAKKIAAEITKLKETSSSISTRKKLLQESIKNLEKVKLDAVTVKATKLANNVIQQLGEQDEQINNAMMEVKQIKQRNKQNQERFKDLVVDQEQDEAIQDTFEELRREALKQAKQKNKKQNVDVVIPKQTQKNYMAQNNTLQELMDL